MTQPTLTPRTLAAYLMSLPDAAQDLPIVIEDWTEGSCNPHPLTEAGIFVYQTRPQGDGGRNASNIHEPCVLITAE